MTEYKGEFLKTHNTEDAANAVRLSIMHPQLMRRLVNISVVSNVESQDENPFYDEMKKFGIKKGDVIIAAKFIAYCDDAQASHFRDGYPQF